MYDMYLSYISYEKPPPFKPSLLPFIFQSGEVSSAAQASARGGGVGGCCCFLASPFFSHTTRLDSTRLPLIHTYIYIITNYVTN